MHDDAQLLRQYVETGSEPAFRELVERHLPMVNATARRMVNGDGHLAQDVTQLVFTDLVRKAATLPTDVVLGGWLHRHTCYTALKAIRTESRRRTRERTAMELTAVNDSTGADAYWAQLAPVLDDALNRLDASDRDALVLRFLQQQDLRSIGRTLGTSEDTAQKRVSRALEKLRSILSRRGLALTSSALLATSLEAAPVTPISSSLAAAVSAHALSSATAAGTGLTLVTLKTMISSKLALGLAATVALVGTTYVFVHQSGQSPASTTDAKLISSVASLPRPNLIAANKVEAPKLAPAPAGNKPATPNDLAASAIPTAGGIGQSGASLVINGRPTMLRPPMAVANGAGTNTVHSSSVTSDGTTVTYVVDGVTQTAPAGTAVTFVGPDSASVVSVSSDPTGVIVGGGGSSTSGSGTSSSTSRKINIVNGQMIVTTTQNGVTTTKTTPAPPSGSILSGSSPGEPDTMVIVDQNGIAHAVPVPAVGTSHAVMITTTPDGTSNTLEISPSPGN